ncbi:MAG TPA: hypothetical protein VKB93_15495 [Thermoanaerobaculia bacterium]|nr:hypothetical protein [Thermoanaerobaculia bacterium]
MAIRSDGGIGLQSPYFDVAHERVRITIEAAAATIVELKDSRLARVDLSAAAKPKIVVAHGGRERAIRAIDDVAAARRISVKQRVTLESLHVSLQERDTGVPAPAGASAQRETSHAVLLASSPIPAFLDPGGVPAKKTGSFSAFEKRWDPSTLTSLLVSFRDNPVWTSFGMQWSSTLESETRELLGRSDRGVFILPAADLTQGEHGGRLRLALRAPTDFMLVLDEAHVFSGLTETLTGLVVIFVKGATVTEVQPLRPEPSSPVIFMRWAVATETLDDSHSREESAVSVLYAGNARGRVSVGQNERPLDSDVNTIALASGETYPDVRVRWAANRLYASCSAGTVERITLNGTSLLPTIWESLSNEARIGVAGGLATFLIGLLLANKSDVRRLWHWATGTLD